MIKSSHAGAHRINRTADLVYLAISVIGVTLTFVLWSFTMGRAFHDHPTVAALADSLFPIAALTMYTRLSLGAGPMIFQVFALAIALQTVPSSMSAPGLTTLASGLVGAWYVSVPTGRGSIIRAGLFAGIAAAIVSGLVAITSGSPERILAVTLGAFVGGVVSGGVALAVSPMAERLFHQVTSLTILEALSYDHQLLRDLMTKAPGTFLHATNVSLLTDAAARAINADALAVRVGALYHDVGKTRNPDFFIENQEHAEGETLGEDVLSAAERGKLLAAHVTDGVEMVLKHGLGERVAIFVREHHGTSRMRSLVERARLDGSVDSELLRYPGPRPQSRETALLMLADQVEASARSTPLPTLEACLAFARRATERIRAEGQLAESGMSDADLEAAIQAFGAVLHAIHHRRFGYPEVPISRHGAPVIAGLRD